LFYTVIFFRGTSKNKSSGFAAAMWAHSYLWTFKCRRRWKNQIIGAKYCWWFNRCIVYFRTFGGSDVAGMRTNAIKKVINMCKWFKDVYHKWCLCWLLYCCC
jgi:hypothetical protein